MLLRKSHWVVISLQSGIWLELHTEKLLSNRIPFLIKYLTDANPIIRIRHRLSICMHPLFSLANMDFSSCICFVDDTLEAFDAGSQRTRRRTNKAGSRRQNAKTDGSVNAWRKMSIQVKWLGREITSLKAQFKSRKN